jgi:hypothetical protein
MRCKESKKTDKAAECDKDAKMISECELWPADFWEWIGWVDIVLIHPTMRGLDWLFKMYSKNVTIVTFPSCC